MSDSDIRAIENIKATVLNFTPRIAEHYSTIFSMDELLIALDRCRNTYSGSDGIRSQMLHTAKVGLSSSWNYSA
jgi:hypothetical protein